MKAPSETREVRYRGVSTEREAHLNTFAAALADLCDKFQIDLEVSVDAESTIEVIERGFPYPEGYTFSATLRGVDSQGVWNDFNPQCKRRRGLDIDSWWFKDEPVQRSPSNTAQQRNQSKGNDRHDAKKTSEGV